MQSRRERRETKRNACIWTKPKRRMRSARQSRLGSDFGKIGWILSLTQGVSPCTPSHVAKKPQKKSTASPMGEAVPSIWLICTTKKDRKLIFYAVGAKILCNPSIALYHTILSNSIHPPKFATKIQAGARTSNTKKHHQDADSCAEAVALGLVLAVSE